MLLLGAMGEEKREPQPGQPSHLCYAGCDEVVPSNLKANEPVKPSLCAGL